MRREHQVIPSDQRAVAAPLAVAGSEPPAWLALLAAILATDNRGTIALSAKGDLLLANAAVGADLAATAQSFGRSQNWATARDTARRQGHCRVDLSKDISGGIWGDLSCVAPDGIEVEFFLLRLDKSKTGDDVSRSDRIAFMAHDLRAPLQALILSLGDKGETLGKDASPAVMAQLALNQIQNLLETARMDAVSNEVDPVDNFDLTALVQDMVTLLTPICAGSGSKIMVDLPKGAQWHRGPAHLIRAILQNLISNAAQLDSQRPISVRLRIAPTGQENLITIEVEDEGPGLSEAAREALLAPRRPGQPSLAHGASGFGLGLGIVTRAVRRLNGRIDIQPGKERGSLFRVSFPLQLASVGTDVAAAKHPVTLDGLRVLVVEDNPVTLSILVQSLTDAGASVEGVANGESALRRVQALKGQLDIVLLDVTLPDIDGIEVARRIRADEKGADTLVILGLTAHVGSVMQGACLAAGMNQVQTKPISPSHLRRALREASEGHGPASQAAITSAKPERHEKMLLDDSQVSEIVEDMGRDMALSFMRRAMAEARQVLTECRADLPAADLRSRIHSAIGSTGLTGLAGVEAGLRGLQDHARRGSRDAEAEATLESVLAQTAAQLESFALSG